MSTSTGVGAGTAPAGAPSPTGVPSPARPGVPSAAAPRRLSRPRWLDPRIIIGLLLVIASVVVGAKVLGADRQTTGVWSASRALAPGTVLAVGDLVNVEVNLGATAGAYVGSADDMTGRILDRVLSPGELLPVDAVAAAAPDQRLLTIGVAPSDMPAGVTHGSVVDLYLVRGGDAGDPEATAVRVGTTITVQSVSGPSSGGLSGAGSSKSQVTVQLPADAADGLLKQLVTGHVQLLLHV